jgi:hypothetical protein
MRLGAWPVGFTQRTQSRKEEEGFARTKPQRHKEGRDLWRSLPMNSNRAAGARFGVSKAPAGSRNIFAPLWLCARIRFFLNCGHRCESPVTVHQLDSLDEAAATARSIPC